MLYIGVGGREQCNLLRRPTASPIIEGSSAVTPTGSLDPTHYQVNNALLWDITPCGSYNVQKLWERFIIAKGEYFMRDVGYWA
jgi:hypothetical protein